MKVTRTLREKVVELRDVAMPKVSKESASESMTLSGYEGHFEELMNYTVGFESYSEDADMAP